MILYYYNIMPKKIVKQLNLPCENSKDTTLPNEDKIPIKTKTSKKKVNDKVEPSIDKVEPSIDKVKTLINKVKTLIDKVEPSIDKVEPSIDNVQKKVTKTRTSKKNKEILETPSNVETPLNVEIPSNVETSPIVKAHLIIAPPLIKGKITKTKVSKKIFNDKLGQPPIKVTKQKNTKKSVNKNLDKTDTLDESELDKIDNLDKPNEYLDRNALDKSYDDVTSDESSEIAQKFLEYKTKWELTHQEIYEHNIKGEQLEFLRRYYISQMAEILENNNFQKYKTNIIDAIIESDNNMADNINGSLDDSLDDLSDNESCESEIDKTLNLKIKNKTIKKPVTSFDSDSD